MTVDVTPIRETRAPGTVPLYQVPGWRERLGLVAGITGSDAGFDLGLGGVEPVGRVMGRWRALREALPEFTAVAQGHQVHGTAVGWHEPFSGWLRLDGTDGHATASRGVLLAITVADCIPVYLAAPKAGAIALLHAGWRGASAGILERGVALLEDKGASAAEIIMHCGVGICGACYEVGSEVLEAFGVQDKEEGPRAIDLRHRLTERASRLGIEDISASGWCSRHDRSRFFSHRAGDGGRMVAFLGMP